MHENISEQILDQTDLQLFQDISASIQASEDFDEMLRAILLKIREALKVDGASIALHKPEKKEFFFIRTVEMEKYGKRDGIEKMRFPDHLGVADELPQTGTIGIKPNLVLSKPSSSGATTDPEIVAALIEYLHARGRRDIVILESAWVGDTTKKAFRTCGYTEISKRFGVPLVDLKKDKTRRVRAGGMTLEICRRAENVDYLINIPITTLLQYNDCRSIGKW